MAQAELAVKLAKRDLELFGSDEDIYVHYHLGKRVFDNMAKAALESVDTDVNSLAYAICKGALMASGKPVVDAVADCHFVHDRKMWTRLAEVVYA